MTERYTKAERYRIVKIFYQNGQNYVQTWRVLQSYYKTYNRPDEAAIMRVIKQHRRLKKLEKRQEQERRLQVQLIQDQYELIEIQKQLIQQQELLQQLHLLQQITPQTEEQITLKTQLQETLQLLLQQQTEQHETHKRELHELQRDLLQNCNHSNEVNTGAALNKTNKQPHQENTVSPLANYCYLPAFVETHQRSPERLQQQPLPPS